MKTITNVMHAILGAPFNVAHLLKAYRLKHANYKIILKEIVEADNIDTSFEMMAIKAELKCNKWVNEKE